MNNMYIPANEFKRLVDVAYSAHQEHNTRKDYRQDGKVPFVVHPLWCALTMLNDQRIPFDERRIGYQVLLLHDVLEDTDMQVPDDVPEEVVSLVRDMTHASWDEEQDIFAKTDFVKMLKLADKIASMYDETVRPDPVRRRQWKELTERLAVDVEAHYGNIRLVTLAKAILADTEW
jgi:(p)ppGpp synthase/HD superfamily hydrolase